jgi:hypothetical protein
MSPTRREILRSAECSYCGYMVPAEGTTIPPEMDISKFNNFVRCTAGTCEPKGGQTVSLIDGRLQYTLPTPSGSGKSESK